MNTLDGFGPLLLLPTTIYTRRITTVEALAFVKQAGLSFPYLHSVRDTRHVSEGGGAI